MSARSPLGPRLIVLLILLAGLLAPSGISGGASEAAPATPPLQATVQRGPVRAGHSPTLVGDINNDGIVDIRDYGLWRLAFGATDCGNPADLDGNCIVDIRDYGIWRLNFGQTGPTVTPTPNATTTATPTATATATPTITPTVTPTLLTGAAYVANSGSNSVTVIDTTTNTVVGTPIPVGSGPRGVGVDPTVHRAYVANNGSASVTVIDTTTNTVIGGPIPVGSGPEGVGIGP
jgi:YVTN family beta-propeller protein